MAPRNSWPPNTSRRDRGHSRHSHSFRPSNLIDISGQSGYILAEVPTMHRRSFLSLAAGAASAAACGQSSLASPSSTLHPVLAGKDRLEEFHNFGITTLAFKVLTEDTH